MGKKQIQIRIFKDGTVKSKTRNIKGKKCTKYLITIEELTGAIAVNSDYTPEYYEEEVLESYTDNSIRMENK